MDTEWLPIEINVPDTVNSVSSGIQNFFQQIPFINRVISQERPRPLYILFVPIRNNNKQMPTNSNQQTKDFYLPFDHFALYP